MRILSYSFIKAIIMNSLEAIVNKHFPLYVDRFNFSLQTIKYVQVVLNSITATTSITVTQDNLFGYTPKMYVWYSEDDAVEILKKIIGEVLFPELQRSPNFKMLLAALLEGYSYKLRIISNKKKKKLDKMCEFEYVRYKRVPYTTNFEYCRFVSRNSYCGIIGLMKPNHRGKVLFKEFGPDSKNRYVTVLEKTKEKIYEYYHDTLILNDAQKELIRLAIDKAIEYNQRQ